MCVKFESKYKDRLVNFPVVRTFANFAFTFRSLRELQSIIALGQILCYFKLEVRYSPNNFQNEFRSLIFPHAFWTCRASVVQVQVEDQSVKLSASQISSYTSAASECS